MTYEPVGPPASTCVLACNSNLTAPAYSIDMYSQLCVYDLEAKKVVHHRELELEGFTHYNALAVAVSTS